MNTKKVVMMISTILLFGALIIFSSVGVCDETSVNILYVGGTGDGNYSSIQEAINASNSGDSIYVYSGIYNETLEVTKSISLIGENKETTIINGKDILGVVTIKASWVNITGFTIKNEIILGSGISIIPPNGYNKIYKNIITNNYVGITIPASDYNKIFNNTISNSSNIGIKIIKVLPAYGAILCSVNNTIYHNNLINNSQHAYDECNNSWFYKNEGNYWDNYTELDKNNDGIGDEPYEIPGGDNVDEYPLMMPYDGKIRLEGFYVDYESLYTMLITGIIVAILFCLPIAYVWYRKYYKVK